jgi:hypothetical protein
MNYIPQNIEGEIKWRKEELREEKNNGDVTLIMNLFLLSLQFYVLSNLFFNILDSVFELKLYC